MYTHLAYNRPVRWSGNDIDIEVDDLGTDDPVVPARITTPAGVLEVWQSPPKKGGVWFSSASICMASMSDLGSSAWQTSGLWLRR